MLSLFDILDYKSVKVETEKVTKVNVGAFSRKVKEIIPIEDGTTWKRRGRPRKAEIHGPPRPPRAKGRKRRDTCPMCNVNPKHVSRLGIRDTYCLDCRSIFNRKMYENKQIALGKGMPKKEMGPKRKAPKEICTICLVRPRAYPDRPGHTRCYECINRQRKERQEQKRKLAREYMGRKDVTSPQRIHRKGISGTDY